MKATWLTILAVIGVIVVFLIVAWFPFPSLYDYVLHKATDLVISRTPFSPFYFRFWITGGALLIAAALVLIMILLRKACQSMELSFFQKALSWGMYYVTVMTVVMILGMWLDFRVGQAFSETCRGDFCRVGFIFYLSYIR